MENKLKRNESGLLDGVEYKFNADNTINWRAMIEPQFLVVKRDSKEIVEKQFGKKISEIDLREVEDKHLLILLQGIKQVLRLRGAKSVEQNLSCCSPDKAAAVCRITFLENFETDGNEFIFSDVGSASYHSTSGFAQLYLESIAANRAFVRCVRNALGINIVARDEIDDGANEIAKTKSPLQQKEEKENEAPTGFTAQDTLNSICSKRSLTFADIQKAAVAKKQDFTTSPDTWTDFTSIPSLDCFTILDKLNSSGDTKKKK